MLASVHLDSRSAASVCLVTGNPNRLVSLLDMYRIAAEKLVMVGRVLQSMQSSLAALASPQRPIEQGVLSQFLGNLENIKTNCDVLKLECTSGLLKWMMDDYRARPHRNIELKSSAEVITAAFEQELGRNLFCYIEPEFADYYRSIDEFFSDPPFGMEMIQSFPSAVRDAALAGNAIAYGLPDACVFHLMLVLEKGLGALAAVFSEPFAHEHWHNVIERIESKIKMINSSNGPDWKAKRSFYSETATQFMFFKDAWRNHVMDGRSDYNPDRAKSIYEHVGEFMRGLAKGGLKELSQP